jgi:hypothetical protein
MGNYQNTNSAYKNLIGPFFQRGLDIGINYCGKIVQKIVLSKKVINIPPKARFQNSVILHFKNVW